jgi:hypothetical protein
MWSPDHILLPSLGSWASWDAFFWSDSAAGRSAMIALQSDLLAALIDAGIPRPAVNEPQPPQPRLEASTASEPARQPVSQATPGDTGGTRALRQGRKPGRRPLAITAAQIAATYWEMADEGDPLDEAKRISPPTQQDVSDRLRRDGYGGNPKSLSQILQGAGWGWPPPELTDDA